MSSLSIFNPRTNPSKTRIGRDDAATDLEHLLPHESQAAEPGDEHDDSESDLEGGKSGTTPEVTTKDDHSVDSNSSTSAAAATPSHRVIDTMRIDELDGGIKYEGRNGDTWAGNAAWIGVVILVLPTWAIVISGDLNTWFVFHPLLQTLALACFTYGILTLQPTSQPKTKAAGFLRHQTAVFFVGFPAITLGTSAVAYNKWLRGANHFTTWHGTFGLLCMLWLLVQIFLGAGSVWNGGILFGGGMKAKALWKYHRLSGYILFPTMMFTAHLGGGWSGWGEKNANGFVRFVTYAVAPALILTGIYIRIRISKMKFW